VRWRQGVAGLDSTELFFGDKGSSMSGEESKKKKNRGKRAAAVLANPSWVYEHPLRAGAGGSMNSPDQEGGSLGDSKESSFSLFL